jgi:hypothetical protein
MDLLVTGMHRSGTSAVSGLLAAAVNSTLLDDPDWAIRTPLMYRSDKSKYTQLEEFDIVKCPRMGGFSRVVAADFPTVRMIWMLRDPRDVAASILEKVRRGHWTSMLTFPELGLSEYGLEIFAVAFQRYMEELMMVLDDCRERICVIDYNRFFVEKEQTIAHLASWIGKSPDFRFSSDLWDKQLGPLKHKFEGIRGPERYKTDLNKSELTLLETPISMWQHALRHASRTF